MGWFEDAIKAVGNVVEAVVDAVSDVLDAVADVVEVIVNVVVEAVADVYTSIGNVIADVFNAIADELKKNPVTGWLGEIIGWVGNIVGAVYTFFGDFVKFIGSVIVGVVRGIINIVRGIITLDGNLILKGLADIATGILGGLLVVAGSLVSVVQTVIPIQGKRRSLTKQEQGILRRIFRNSLALYNIRIIEGEPGLFGINNRPFTLGNTIYLKNDRTMHTLVHEAVHVWQYHHLGSQYATEALGAQSSLSNAYNWENDITSGRTEWENFNLEGQGAFIESVYLTGQLLTTPTVTTTNGAFFDADDSTPNRFMDIERTRIANNAVTLIRSKISFRISQFFN
jgi:hypothetical protein